MGSKTPAAGLRAGVSEEGAGKENVLLYQFRHNFLHIIIVDLSAELYVESIFLKLFEKLLGTVNTNLFCWTQRGFSLNAFGLNHYIQFHITVCFLYHIHKIRTIVVNHRWDRYTPSRNLTENNDISNIRNNVFLFQIRVKSYSLIKIFN